MATTQTPKIADAVQVAVRLPFDNVTLDDLSVVLQVV